MPAHATCQESSHFRQLAELLHISIASRLRFYTQLYLANPAIVSARLSIPAVIAGRIILLCSRTSDIISYRLVSVSGLCFVFESPGPLSIMSETLRKRGREQGALPDSTDVREPKRFNGEETNLFCHLLQLEKTLAEEEESAPNEDFVSGVMRSLEEEISATCSNFYALNSGDNPLASDISSGQTLVSDLGIDLCSLLETSEDDLGILSTPILDLKDQVYQSPKETLPAEGILEDSDVKSLGENWHFKDEIDKYQLSALYEDPCDASELQDCMNRDFISQDLFFEGDFSVVWPFETAGCM